MTFGRSRLPVSEQGPTRMFPGSIVPDQILVSDCKATPAFSVNRHSTLREPNQCSCQMLTPRVSIAPQGDRDGSGVFSSMVVTLPVTRRNSQSRWRTTGGKRLCHIV